MSVLTFGLPTLSVVHYNMYVYTIKIFIRSNQMGSTACTNSYCAKVQAAAGGVSGGRAEQLEGSCHLLCLSRLLAYQSYFYAA